ncbi:MAG: hypothetical protein JNN07_13785 [Verrucomicrobiales bacterium]|nr:hypothetical protein [Verrucomicrobiales bacterium]
MANQAISLIHSTRIPAAWFVGLQFGLMSESGAFDLIERVADARGEFVFPALPGDVRCRLCLLSTPELELRSLLTNIQVTSRVELSHEIHGRHWQVRCRGSSADNVDIEIEAISAEAASKWVELRTGRFRCQPALDLNDKRDRKHLFSVPSLDCEPLFAELGESAHQRSFSAAPQTESFFVQPADRRLQVATISADSSGICVSLSALSRDMDQAKVSIHCGGKTASSALAYIADLNACVCKVILPVSAIEASQCRIDFIIETNT